MRNLLIVTLMAITCCHAQIPTLDADFGSSGVTLADLTNGLDAVGTIGRQSDGKLVATVFGTYSIDGSIRLARFTENGLLDTTFGVNGMVETPFFCLGTDSKQRIAVQSDNKILVVGGIKTSVGLIHKNALTRYEADGSLDMSFGDMGLSGGPGTSEAECVTVLEDGSIMVLGGSSSGVVLSKYLTSGYWDMGYADGGRISFSFTDSTDDIEWAKKIIVQPDGTVLVLVEVEQLINDSRWRAPAVAKLTASGEFVTDFGSEGKWMGEMTKESNAYDFSVLPDGTIVIVGDQKSLATSFREGTIMKLDSAGNPISSFGSGGVVFDTLSGGTGDTTFHSNLILDGKILCLAYLQTSLTTGDIGLARYLPDGTLDTTFGNQGKYILDATGGVEVAVSMYLQPDGKCVVGGLTFTSALLARLDVGNLGTSEDRINLITAWPNPFSDKVVLSGLTSETQVALCDLSGKVLHESYLQPDQPVWPLPQSLAKGVYLLKLVSGNAYRTLKLVKS
ncbi:MULTISPECIES: T9SS type A sorting domain-containing protein [unclassified Flavobacterium]|uniref:T9SS type A sorting domain-containing protein n=1 Tax=unclassified Flavobacterium TaxID=196869 RepID=UPI001F12B58D|nr:MULTISPECIES: T9SS type A sorting domain-containing protein [unclassified Flavobacterium]UMY67162.1 T9SS type A sorting domain-containing protein [Flavobacterium sp. HJ-32-4]